MVLKKLLIGRKGRVRLIKQHCTLIERSQSWERLWPHIFSRRSLSSPKQRLSILWLASCFRGETTTYWLQNLGFLKTGILIPTSLPLIFWMTLNKFLKFFKPRFSYLENGDNDFTYIIVLLWGFNKTAYVKHMKSKVSINNYVVTCHGSPKVLSSCTMNEELLLLPL